MAKQYTVKTHPPASAFKNGAKQGRQQSSSKGNNQINAISTLSTCQIFEERKQKSLTCALCKNDHRLSDCKEFKSKSVEVRANMIKDWGYLIHREFNNQTLDTLMNQFSTTESFGVRSSSSAPTMSHDDRAALLLGKHYPTHRREVLMQRKEDVVFPDNREPVYRQFLSMMRKCQCNKVFGDAYSKMMNDWISLRHAIKAEVQQPSPRWFLMHHGVTNPN